MSRLEGRYWIQVFINEYHELMDFGVTLQDLTLFKSERHVRLQGSTGNENNSMNTILTM